MSNVRIPQGFWAAMAVVFALLTVLFLVKGMFLMVLLALAFAVWTGLEAAGRGVFAGREPTRPAS